MVVRRCFVKRLCERVVAESRPLDRLWKDLAMFDLSERRDFRELVRVLET